MSAEQNTKPKVEIRKYRGGLNPLKVSIALGIATTAAAAGIGIGYLFSHLAFEISSEYFYKHLFVYHEFMSEKDTFIPDVPADLIDIIFQRTAIFPSCATGAILGVFSLRMEGWRKILSVGMRMVLLSFFIVLGVSLLLVSWNYLLPSLSTVKHDYPLPVINMRHFVTAGALLQGAMAGSFAAIVYSYFYSKKRIRRNQIVFV